MGKRGPQPKPTALRLLEGNPGRLPINEAEPRPEGGAIAPTWLSRAARRHWRDLAPKLEACGMLTAADADTLAHYCDAHVRMAAAAETIERQGALIEGEHGPKLNPVVRVHRHYAALVSGFGKRLGLAPADRPGIKAATPRKGRWAALIA